MEDLVSIIMPTYNSGRFVMESIESIIRQSYYNFELLITDDASSDNTMEILESCAKKDKRIRIFRLPKNMGAGSARNNSIKEAKGRYIAFCDSDDTWMPDKLEKQIRFMQKYNYCFCFASYFTCNEEGKRQGVVIAPSSVSLIDTKRDDKIGFLTAIYDTSFYGKFYMPTLRKRQDWAFVLQILQKCKMAYALKEPLACYRLSKSSISSNKLSLLRFNAKVYKTVFGYSTLHSYFYLFGIFLPLHILKLVNKRIVNIRYKKKISTIQTLLF